MTGRPWHEFDPDASDASGSIGLTKLTEDAHTWAFDRAKEQFGLLPAREWSFVAGGSRLRIRTPHGYVAEVRGQSSATAHGKQGAHPLQIAEARALELPVLMVFKDGGIVWSVWLDDPGPDIVNIDRDGAHRRQGWWCRQMTRDLADEFRFPAAVPTFETTGLF